MTENSGGGVVWYSNAPMLEILMTFPLNFLFSLKVVPAQKGRSFMWGNFVINQVFITFVTCWLSLVIPILLNLFLLSLSKIVSFFTWQWIVLSADFDHQRPDLFSSRHGGNIWTRSRRPALQVFWNIDSPALTIKSKIEWPKLFNAVLSGHVCVSGPRSVDT